MDECKCSECFAEPVCVDDRLPVGMTCREMREAIWIFGEHLEEIKERTPKVVIIRDDLRGQAAEAPGRVLPLAEDACGPVRRA